MKLIEGNWGAVEVEDPPYYWVAPVNFPGIDGALILPEAIYGFQVTLSTRHEPPNDGWETLWAHLPANLQKIPWRAWRVVFVRADSTIKTVANKWAGKLFATDNTSVTTGCSEVDPVVKDITYRVFHDESDPDVEVHRVRPDREALTID
ncbi:hypothetical protein OG21DRAFT_1484325 [Imleria badia]|nr:hypothetical protein OG21DRAFT_1484325 [Imleria badia]